MAAIDSLRPRRFATGLGVVLRSREAPAMIGGKGRVDAFSFEEAIGIADAALYLAKEGGRDRATYACPRDDQPTPRIERGGTPYHEPIKDGSLFVIESLAGPAGA